MRHLKTILLFSTLLSLNQYIFAQECKIKGPLRWIAKDSIYDQTVVYKTQNSIQALLFNPQHNTSDSIDIDIKIVETNTELTLAVTTVAIDEMMPLKELPTIKKAYKIAQVVPKPYPKQDKSYQQLAQAIEKAAKTHKKLTIYYAGAIYPFSGCFQLDLSQGLGLYDIQASLEQLQKLENKKKQLSRQLKKIKQEKEKINQFLQQEKERLLLADQARTTIREQHKNFSTEEQNILTELIQLSDEVNVGLNAALISNKKEDAMKVADLTGKYQKRLNVVKKMAIYKNIASSFDNYYKQSTYYFTNNRNIMKFQNNILGLEKQEHEIQEKLKNLKKSIEEWVQSNP